MGHCVGHADLDTQQKCLITCRDRLQVTAQARDEVDMRAYQLPQATGIDALTKVQLPIPRPGARQVLVKVAACSLNYRDLAIALGSYRMSVKPNLVVLS